MGKTSGWTLMQSAARLRLSAAQRVSAHRRSLSIVTVFGVVWLTLLLAGPTRSFAVQVFGLVLFYGFLVAVLSRTSVWKTARELNVSTRWSLFGAATVFSVFFGWYFHQYRYFPVWDSIAYWSKTLQFNARLGNSVHLTLQHMLDTVNSDDYNELLCWIASLPVRIFPQWAATFFIVAVMFLIPAALVLSLFIFSRLKQAAPSIRECLVVPALFICLLGVPIFLIPVFSGFLDSIAAVLFVVILVAVFDSRFPQNRTLAVLTGVGVCGTFLLRRWFVYAVIGLAAAALVYWVLIVLTRPSGKWSLLGRLLSDVCIMAMVACIVLMPCGGFLQRSFFGGQSTAYRSWTKWDSMKDKLIHVGQSIGWFWIAASVAATVAVCVIAIAKRSRPLQQNAALLVSMPVGAFGALLPFWTIQDMGAQHWYIMIFFFEIFCFLSLMTACSLIRRSWLRATGIVATAVLSVIGFLHGFGMFAGLPTGVNAVLQNVTGPVAQRPMRQNDYNEKIRFTQFLRQRTGGTKTVYFAAASLNLNASLPRSVCLPECTAAPFVSLGADVDSRDGFNTQFFNADFVVASSPVSLHMSEQNEQVVSFLNGQVMDSQSPIGKHYRRIRAFSFADGYTDAARGTTTVYVYERISDFTKDDVRYVKSVFHKKYPQLPKLFDDRFDSYLSQMNDKHSS